MTDVTKEDIEELKTAFLGAITDLSSTLTEALKPVVTPVEGEQELVESKEDEEKVVITIDHAAVVEALRTNELPAASAGAVIAALNEGKSLDEAIKVQTDLREAFVSSGSESGTVVLQESGKATGLARAVELLG